ncbi:flavin-containing monooxygenase [Saccharopolyspora elongata]|uniref:NAD(P)/FAD-dependent oxidoreductase n=1 Tax=Saccharopolyspora elongata TaxID=2530387 RepID=A0A4V2YIV9_9PSEU|nr:NAD(P)/FAD-dependent oxidoreductase [Saccharopolyspora elongata]TDD36467.1 NAD(P)/FAD-dependent oxidoreductase [Saccharopolyspora elongata]
MAINDDDDFLRAAIGEAEIPALLPALAQLTGDLSLLRDDLRPDPTDRFSPQGALGDEQLAAARELALRALADWRDRGCPAAPELADDQVRRLIDFSTSGALDGYLPLLVEELAHDGDPGRPDWTKAELAADAPLHVVIIGAGMSGLAAAHRLQQAGVPFEILEKNSDVGGTWLENTYPGCRVDVTNHLYSFSFTDNHDWPGHFSTQRALLDYFRDFADEQDLKRHIRFGTEVVAAEYVEAEHRWELEVRDAAGSRRLRAQAVISAVGQLNRPSYPKISGLADFAGPSFHSARWDHDVDLTGKRVAVIGTGASAVQFVPIIAEQAAEVHLFQRTPPWLVPTPDYHDPVQPGLRWLLRNVPHYARWYRFWLFCRSAEGVLPAVAVDPDWTGDPRSVSARNEELRQLLVAYLEMSLPDDPELVRKVTPQYPPAAKRMLRDNGTWPATLQREDVHLVTEPIQDVTATGVRTADGRQHDADVLILATGFQASNFLTPMRVTGRDGVNLHRRWGGDARAYLGITVPEFPNFFMIYGPNTNIVVNGSIIFFSECAVNYIVGCLRLLLERGSAALECRAEVHDGFNADVDRANLLMSWGKSTVHSWYKNEHGRVAQNWPFSLMEYWKRTKRPDPADFLLRGGESE